MSEHEIKSWPDPFHARWLSQKSFEVREDDRGYSVGDTLYEREWDPEREYYTGFRMRGSKIIYISRGFRMPKKLCVLGLDDSKTERFAK